MINADPETSSYLTGFKEFFSGGVSGETRNYLIKGTAGVFALQIVGIALGFVTNIILARLLGATEYGVYSYVFAWVAVLTILSMFGFGRLLVREIAAYLTKSEWSLIHGILRYVGTRAFLISICVAIVAAVTTWFFRDRLNPLMFPAFWVALAILPFLTLLNLSNDAQQGFRRVTLGRIPAIFFRVLFILLILVAYWSDRQNVVAIDAVSLHLVATGAALIFALGLLYKTIPRQVIEEIPDYQQRLWLQSALPLLLVVGFAEINSRAPLIFLGTLVGPQEAGIYSVAVLVSGVIGFILIAADVALSPVISGFYSAGEMSRLQTIVTRSTRITSAIAIAVALVIILLRHWLLPVFGQEFGQAGVILIILSFGRLATVFAGPAGILLMMTGNERYSLIAVAISSVATILLSAIFIPRWELEGAALAATISLLLLNMIMIFQARRHVGIASSIVGPVTIRRR